MLLRPASELTTTPIDWLWPGYLAVGSLAILDGDPGLGKSLLTLDLAARLSTGRPWPDGAASPGPRAALVVGAEDPEAIVKERLALAGADLSRVFPWTNTSDLPLPRLPKDIAILERVVNETGAAFVMLDPIVAFFDGSVMWSSDASVRAALLPLAKLADEHRAVILMVRH